MKKTIGSILILALFVVFSTFCGAAETKKLDREQLKSAFDVVAQNLGALEYAYYTFTLEFERTPENIDEMISTGHLRVEMGNPYSKDPVHLGTIGETPIPGALYYKKESKTAAQFVCHFIDPNAPDRTRWLQRRIVMFTHQELKKAVFGDNASRNEKLTRVYLLQMGDALDSFEQRYGKFPASWAEMSKIGDVNVKYLNPMTGKLVKQTDKFSPGDFLYRTYAKGETRKVPYKKPDGTRGYTEQLCEEYYYELVGWGEKEPVYYYSNDPDKENFEWVGETGKAKVKSVRSTGMDEAENE
jgi:hypothetical protein